MLDSTKDAHTAIAVLLNNGLNEQANVLHNHYFVDEGDYSHWPESLLEAVKDNSIDPREIEELYDSNLNLIENIKNVRYNYGLPLREAKRIVDEYNEYLKG